MNDLIKESEPFIVYYKVNFKYQLARTYIIKTNILGYTIDTPFVSLNPLGFLTIRFGFGWDGASGPTIDTDTSQRGSLVHDAIYYLLRLGKLSEPDRYIADKLLGTICREDGMWEFRANAWSDLVALVGQNAASPENKKKLHIAPDTFDYKLIDIQKEE